MSQTDAIVVDAEGLSFRARLEPATTDTDKNQILLQLEDGAQFLLPAELLDRRADGRYDLRLKLREYAAQTDLGSDSAQGSGPDLNASEAGAGLEASVEALTTANAATGEVSDETVIPVVEETLQVGKRTVTRGRVQLRKYVTERTETADILLAKERVEVERVKVDRQVDEAAPVRYEGDTMIVPLYEEVLVVTKQLRLVEEVRITTQRTEENQPQQVTLRREEVDVERVEGEAEPSDE